MATRDPELQRQHARLEGLRAKLDQQFGYTKAEVALLKVLEEFADFHRALVLLADDQQARLAELEAQNKSLLRRVTELEGKLAKYGAA